MTYPLSIQLYSLREAAQKDPQGTLARVAAMGFLCVEGAGFWGWSPREFRRRVEDLGMRFSGSHAPWAKPESIQQAIDTAGELGLDVVAGGYGKDAFKDLDAIGRTCDEINLMCERLERAGLRLFLHNHAWEFERFDGRCGHDIVFERCPRAWFEIDTYWAANFGAEDPAAAVARFAQRTLFLHLKDGSLQRDTANLALGTGRIDVPAVVAAAAPRVLRAVVVEFDRCDTDVFAAVRASRDFLVARGLAVARPVLGA